MTVLQCEKLVAGGLGIARTEQGIVLVEGLLPGECGEVTPAGKRGGTACFSKVRVVADSPDRRQPPCPYFGECGGCDWLHIKYAAQLKAKQQIFADVMRRIGGLEEYPQPELYSGEEFAARCRVQLQVDNKACKVGFFRRRSHTVIDINSCPLLHPRINELLQHKAVICSQVRGRKMKVIAVGGKLLSDPVLPDHSLSETIFELNGRHIALHGNSFFQNNIRLLGELTSWGGDILRGEHLLDLYGGTGLFSLFHAENFHHTTLIERDRRMVKAANKNFRRNQLSAVAKVAAAEQLTAVCRAQEFDAAIIDPPRRGMTPRVIEALAAVAPKNLLYISCNPATQARDAAILVKQHNYKIIRSAIFDLYPNTSHLETALLLQYNP